MIGLLPILFAAVVFIGTAKLIDRYQVNLFVAAFLATVPSFIVSALLLMAYAGRFNWDVITTPMIITVIFQYIVSLFIFWKVSYGVLDEIFGWAAWVVGGAVTVIFIVPTLVNTVMSF